MCLILSAAIRLRITERGLNVCDRYLDNCRDPWLGLRVRNKLCVMCRKRVMAGPTTNSSSETPEVSGLYTVGVVEELEDNIFTLNTSVSPLRISPFKKQKLRRSKQYAKVQLKRVGTAIKLRPQVMNVKVSDTSSDPTGES